MLEKRKEINEKIKDHLMTYYPKIKEANDISEALNRNIKFLPFVDSINLMPLQAENGVSEDPLIVKVKVINHECGWVNYWTLEKFEERLELMREALDNFFNYN